MVTLLERHTAIGLPAPESDDEPATTMDALLPACSPATGTSSWSSGPLRPSDGAFCWGDDDGERRRSRGLPADRHEAGLRVRREHRLRVGGRLAAGLLGPYDGAAGGFRPPRLVIRYARAG